MHKLVIPLSLAVLHVSYVFPSIPGLNKELLPWTCLHVVPVPWSQSCPLIESLFAVPQDPIDGKKLEPPMMIWIHKLRGFCPEEDLMGQHLSLSNLAFKILGVSRKVLKTLTYFICNNFVFHNFSNRLNYIVFSFSDCNHENIISNCRYLRCN